MRVSEKTSSSVNFVIYRGILNFNSKYNILSHHLGGSAPQFLKPKFSMFCTLPQDYQHCFEKETIIPCRKFSEKLKTGVNFLKGNQSLVLLIKSDNFF